MKKLVNKAERQGWTVDVTSNSHVRFKSPTGQVVIGDGAGHGELDHHYKKTVKRLKDKGLRNV